MDIHYNNVSEFSFRLEKEVVSRLPYNVFFYSNIIFCKCEFSELLIFVIIIIILYGFKIIHLKC